MDRTCWGRTRNFERCRRGVGRKERFCYQHRKQPLVLLILVLVPLLADLRSLYESFWLQDGKGGSVAEAVAQPEVEGEIDLALPVIDFDQNAERLPSATVEEEDAANSPATVRVPSDPHPRSAPGGKYGLSYSLDETLRYRVESSADSLEIVAYLPYFERLKSGAEITGVDLNLGGAESYPSSHSPAPFRWEYPRVSLKLLNRGPGPLSIGSIKLVVDKIEPNPEPVLFFADLSTRRTLLIVNEGWGPVLRPRLSFTISLPAGNDPAGWANQAQASVVSSATDIELRDFHDQVRVPLTPYLPSVLKTSGYFAATIRGILRYETVGGKKREVPFRTRTWIGSEVAGYAVRPTVGYGLLVDVSEPQNEYLLPVAHLLPDGSVEHIELELGATQSALVEGRLLATSFGGRVLLDRKIRVRFLVPRSMAPRCDLTPPSALCLPRAFAVNEPHEWWETATTGDRRAERSTEVHQHPQDADLEVIVRVEATEMIYHTMMRLTEAGLNAKFTLTAGSIEQNVIKYPPGRESLAEDVRHAMPSLDFAVEEDNGLERVKVWLAVEAPSYLVVFDEASLVEATWIASVLEGAGGLVTLVPSAETRRGAGQGRFYVGNVHAEAVRPIHERISSEVELDFEVVEQGDPKLLGYHGVIELPYESEIRGH